MASSWEERLCRRGHLDEFIPVQLLGLPPPDRHGLSVPPKTYAQVRLVKDADRVELMRIDLLHQVFRVVQPGWDKERLATREKRTLKKRRRRRERRNTRREGREGRLPEGASGGRHPWTPTGCASEPPGSLGGLQTSGLLRLAFLAGLFYS